VGDAAERPGTLSQGVQILTTKAGEKVENRIAKGIAIGKYWLPFGPTNLKVEKPVSVSWFAVLDNFVRLRWEDNRLFLYDHFCVYDGMSIYLEM
jgi:hypothetical protein